MRGRILFVALLTAVNVATAALPPSGLKAQTSSAGAFGQPSLQDEVPSIVIDGFRAYVSAGPKKALEVWLKGSPANTGSTAQLEQGLAGVGAAYGAMVGHEVVATIKITPHFRRVYAVMLFERGPLFSVFDCYRTSESWIVTGFLTNTKAQEILPESVLSGAVPK